MNKKVVIYFGPKKYFEEYIEQELDVNISKSKKLTNVVSESEAKRKEFVIVNNEDRNINKELIEIDNLIVYTDEYASVNEHVILNFEGFLSNYKVNNLILHNPPDVISNKMRALYSDLIEKQYSYKNLTLSILRDFDKNYNKEIIGQEQAREDIMYSIYPLLRDSFNKPVVIMFYGSSGVGKTQTAKYLSLLLGGELFRKQFSMFQNNEFLNYLFGGYHSENCFAKELLNRETNVILLDEFDKSNSLFHSAFYQLFDEGVFVDKNYTVEIGKPIVICTSNYLNLNEIRNNLGDPIFSRIDVCIGFKDLSLTSIKKIIENQIEIEFNLLEDNEKVLIKKKDIKNYFEGRAKNIKNARFVENIVRQKISKELLTKQI